MTEYTILSADNRLNLEAIVRDAIKMGWKLQGGVAVAPEVRSASSSRFTEIDTYFYFYQAMTRDAE